MLNSNIFGNRQSLQWVNNGAMEYCDARVKKKNVHHIDYYMYYIIAMFVGSYTTDYC